MLALLSALLFSNALHAESPVSPSVQSNIAEHGAFAYTDGSSVMRLSSDGSFSLQPAGMSGRSVEGWWETEDGSRFFVRGLWGWMNGVSPLADYRQMQLYLSYHGGDPTPDARTGEPIYPVYAVVEGLSTQPTKLFSGANLKVNPARPTGEITAGEAHQRAGAGQTHYVAMYDDQGRIIALEKRHNHRSVFRYAWRYEGGAAVRTDR